MSRKRFVDSIWIRQRMDRRDARLRAIARPVPARAVLPSEIYPYASVEVIRVPAPAPVEAPVVTDPTVTHYAPWDESEPGDDVATCGHRMTAADVHSPQPTCLPCTVRLAAIEAADDDPLPLDADEARTALDPVLNAGVPARPMSPLGAELFALATTLNRLALLRLLDEEVMS